jgi:DsbC/DsbD-like thiol-disulfide interchange protein
MKRRIQFRLHLLLVLSGSILLSACHRSSGATEGHQNAPIERRDPAIAIVDNQPKLPIVNGTSPVTASVRTDKTDVRRGGEFNLLIEIQIAAGWHIYAMDRRASAAVPTKIRLQLSKGLESSEKWTSPEPMLSPMLHGEPVFVYEGKATFRRAVRILPDAALTSLPVRCTLVYQTCDQFSCRPPAEIKLETKIRVIP